MLKTELEVVTVGTPDITALSDDERRVFFETIMARVLELAKERNSRSDGVICNAEKRKRIKKKNLNRGFDLGSCWRENSDRALCSCLRKNFYI